MSQSQSRAPSALQISILLVALTVSYRISLAIGDASVGSVHYHLQIGSCPLDEALQQLARQSGIQIVFFSGITDGLQSPPLSGEYTLAAALDRLLAHSRLTFRVINPSTVEVHETEADSSRSSTLSAHQKSGELSHGEGEKPDSPAGLVPPSTMLEEIAVTGSRLSQTTVTAPMPIVALKPEDIERAGQANIADVLTQLPQVGVGLSGANTERNFQGDAGVNFIDLRNLGYARTLVLVDGMRQVAGDPFTAAVDLNTIPSEFIEKVEIVTGGTSAVYGADAVSGVVNIVLRKNFQGLQLLGHEGVTSRGDGEQHGFSLEAGKNFEDNKGNATLNFLYDKVNGVDATDRWYASDGLYSIQNPAHTGPSTPMLITRPDVLFNGPDALGVASVGGVLYTSNSAGTAVRPFNYGSIGNQGGLSIGGDGENFQIYDTLSTPLERGSALATVGYELNEHATLSMRALVTRSEAVSYWQPVEDPIDYPAPTISVNNPYVPADLRTIATAADQQSFQLLKVWDEFGRRGSDVVRTEQQYTVALDGPLFKDWTYSAFAAYGATDVDALLLNFRNQARFLDSLDVILLDGVPACASAAARASGCQPLNPFGTSTASLAAINYSRMNDPYGANTDLRNAGAHVTGRIAQLPAGALEAVAGVEAREASASTHPSLETQQGGDFNGPELPISGTIKVRELFGELRAPLLKDRLLAKDLTAQIAARMSHYNLNGTNSSWNAGGAYEPFEGIRIRAMRSRAVRAPNTGELFAPLQTEFEFVQDPCDASVVNVSAVRVANCRALGLPANFQAPTNVRTTRSELGGNPYLRPETANTWTLGMVLTPPFMPDFLATMDIFNAQITDAIDSIPVQTILDDCVDLSIPVGKNPLCSLISRDPSTGGITDVRASERNIGKFTSSGVDFLFKFRFNPSRSISRVPGIVELDLTGTYLRRLRYFTNAADPASEIQLEGTTGIPQWNALASVTYHVGRWDATWRAHYFGSTAVTQNGIELYPPAPPNQLDLPNTGVEVYQDLSVGYSITHALRVRFNVNNVFDEIPPRRTFLISEGTYDAAIYPNLGRTFLLKVIYKL